MRDLLNHPSLVRDKILPKYGSLFVTRFGKVVMEIRVPDLKKLGYTFETFS
jgi:hypothetical protein